MRFQILLGDLWLNGTIEERVKELEFVFFASFAHDWNEIDEFGVVDGTVELTAVFDHEENFIGKIGVLNLQQLEILEQLPLANYIVFRQSFKFFFDLGELFHAELGFSLLNAKSDLRINDAQVGRLVLLGHLAVAALRIQNVGFYLWCNELITKLVCHAAIFVTHLELIFLFYI